MFGFFQQFGIRCVAGRIVRAGCGGHVDRPIDDVLRPGADLIVDADHVLAEDADAQGIEAPKKLPVNNCDVQPGIA